MSYELYTRGGSGPEKITLTCPKCGEKCEVLWVPSKSHTYRQSGTTGISETATNRSGDKVTGDCKCGYEFKPKDLDEW